MAELTSAAFASSVSGTYTLQTSGLSGPVASTADNLVSQTIDTGIRSIENKKIVTGIQITTAFADVAAHLAYQLSHDGTNWSATVDISTDVAAGATKMTTGTYVHIWDLTDVYAPYMRLVMNPTVGTENIGTSGVLKFFFAYKTSTLS